MVRPSRKIKEIIDGNKVKQPRSIGDTKSDQQQTVVVKQVKLDEIRARTIEKIKKSEENATNASENTNKATRRKRTDDENKDVAEESKRQKTGPETGKAKVELKKRSHSPSPSKMTPKAKKQSKLMFTSTKSSPSIEPASSRNNTKSNEPKCLPTSERATKQQPTLKVKEVSDNETSTIEKTNLARRTYTNQKQKQKHKAVIYKEKIVCKYCNLKFISPSWHEKHLRQSHADLLRDEGIEVRNTEPVLIAEMINLPVEDETMEITDSDRYTETFEYIESFEPEQQENVVVYDTDVQTQKNVLQRVKVQVEQTNEMRKALEHHKKIIETKKQKKLNKKLSPNKLSLREELKSKLAAQQELLRMQQQIFEQANKAQSDILKMIGDLEQMDSDEEEENQVQNEADEPVNTSTLIEYATTSQVEQNVVVVVRTEEGEEEFELVEIEDSTIGNAVEPERILPEEPTTTEELEKPVVLEVIKTDGENVHYRIVQDAQGNDPLFVSNEGTQEEIIDYPVNNDANVKNLYVPDRKVNKKKKADLLNNSKQNEKDLNTYIQQVVRTAEPTADNKFLCPLCPELVSNRYSLGPHILRLHSKHKSKICPHCDRAFTCTGDLTRHIRIHTGDKPFVCSYPNCTYAFRASGDLYKHVRRHTATDDATSRPHICDDCGRGFERGYDLKRHVLTHKKHDENVGYKCTHCPKRFFRKDQHKAHVFRHLGIKPYKCPDCGKLFGDFSNCSKHIKQNTCKADADADETKKYMCDSCHRKFKSKMGLKLHVVKCSIKKDDISTEMVSD